MNKGTLIIGGFVATIGIALYPIYFYPKKRPDVYCKYDPCHQLFGIMVIHSFTNCF